MFTFGQSIDDSTAAKPAAAATSPFSFGTAGQAGANKSTFTFNKTPSTQTGTKMDAPFSFSSASSNKTNPTPTLQPESPMSSSPFAFGKTENKQSENATFSFVKPSSNANLPQGNIFQFATNQASNSSQGTAAAPRRADTAPFQFGATASTSTLQPSVPQKSFSFGPSTTSNSSEPFKFDTSTGGSTSGTAQPAPIFGSVKPTSTFGAASSTSPFGAVPSVTKPATATPNLFQFSPSSGTGPRTQLTGGNSGTAGVFKFGNTGSGAAATATSPFGATLAPQNAPPAFGSTTAGSAPGVGSQSTPGFNFTTNANTAVPGVFQFGASSPPAANPAAAGSAFSFGSTIANAPSFGTIPPVAQQGAPPGGNMFSIGTSGSSTNTKGRTIRTATRRRPK